MSVLKSTWGNVCLRVYSYLCSSSYMAEACQLPQEYTLPTPMGDKKDCGSGFLSESTDL